MNYSRIVRFTFGIVHFIFIQSKMNSSAVQQCLTSIDWLGNVVVKYYPLDVYAISVRCQDSVCQVPVEHVKQNLNDTLDGTAGVQSGADSICSETEKIFVALPQNICAQYNFLVKYQKSELACKNGNLFLKKIFTSLLVCHL